MTPISLLKTSIKINKCFIAAVVKMLWLEMSCMQWILLSGVNDVVISFLSVSLCFRFPDTRRAALLRQLSPHF